MATFCDELGIPKQHIKETSNPERFIVIADKGWLKALEQRKLLTEFPTCLGLDMRVHNTDLEHPWTRVCVQLLKKSNQKVIPLPKLRGDENSGNQLPLTFSQLIAYVTNTNFNNLWADAYKKYDQSRVKFAKQNGSPLKILDANPALGLHDCILRELIQRVFNCPIVAAKTVDPYPYHPNGGSQRHDSHANILPALAAIELATSFLIVFYPPAIEVTLYDCITYSPAVLSRSHNKPLFLIYQLFQLIKHFHDCGLLIGDLRLQDIFLQDNLWLQVVPKLQSNVIQHDVEIETPSEDEYTESTKFDLKFAYDLEQFSLREYCEMWSNGQLSNFDYLTILNNATGRRVGSPEYHHIMPWVTDFTHRNGMNWRDLSKSKYRLNKGDPHLDLMFTSHSSSSIESTSGEAPHHVSDFLSDITYYVYMARRTPQHILCQHVRPIWVPAEYPVSIQRLQQWTPDECIPEFYSDPMVFKSIHEDLADLELPGWASCPEDFVVKHREALESQYVSERLHYWIDLNFGYKLTGKAAVKSKNVCLSLVDNHKNLCQRGIVQLFTQPHPPKRFPSPWFGKLPPRLTTSADQRRRLAHSSEDISNLKSPAQDVQGYSTNPKPALHIDSPANVERSSSFYTTLSSTIVLPKGYNPVSFLQSLENMETFFAKTFLNQKSDQSRSDKLAQNDMLFEESDNSFTNQLFTENFEDVVFRDRREKSNKNCLVQSTSRKNFKQIIMDKRAKELHVVGCLIVELFLASKIRPLTMASMSISFEERLESCCSVACTYFHDLPKCLRYAVKLLLGLDGENKGLPPPTAHQITEPILSNTLIPFPSTYIRVYALVRILKSFDFNSTLLELFTHFHCNGSECSKYIEIDRKRVLYRRKIAECKVKAFCAQIESLLEPMAYEQFSPVELLLPHINELIQNEETSILTAWYLFDPMATALGTADTHRYLLEPILKLYDCEASERIFKAETTSSVKFATSSSFKSRKSVKLYHHSFLLRLIVRFGLKCFLDNFIPPLIEAVGGYKEPEDSTGLHYHSNKNPTSHSNWTKKKNLKFCTDESENSLTLISPECSLSFDATPKQVIEDVFSFDDDSSDKTSNVIDVESKSVDSFDIRATHAEEATEDASVFSAEKLAINDIIFAHQRLSNNSFDDDKVSVNSATDSTHKLDAASGPKSPVIPIPTAFRRSYELSTIDCEIGSKKSFDSFDLPSTQTNEDETKFKQESNDSMQASVISKISEAKVVQDNRISEMSTESLIWLSHRLGPVLTARYVTRNLLRMLSLCYATQENLLPQDYSTDECANLNYFSIADSKVVGDGSAARTLECLTSIAALFGEQFIILQYLPHASELTAQGRKRITPNLESAVISSLQLLKYLIPCLMDTTIMEHLQDIILDSIINPIISLLGTTRCLMPNGYLGRSVLARKLLDVLYVLAVRIGPEMTKEHLCAPTLQRFFLIFDKAYGILNHFPDTKDQFCISPPGVIGVDESIEHFDFQLKEKAMEEIRDVFGPNLAHCAYLTFLRFLGESIMTKTIRNLEFVLTLCHEFEQPDYGTNDSCKRLQSYSISARRLSDEDFIGSNSFGTSVIGNRIDVVSTAAKQEMGPMEVLDMVAWKFEHVNTSRHLRGNWLANWRHEISRAEKDTHLNMKQIKLQTFAGHTNSVRAILALDNENSFMSASKDKTVKLWSLRSEGDGKKISSCQFTYNSHKKSVHSLAFLESMRFVVSCDSGVHLWDPFIGRPLGILDSHKYSPITVVRTFPSPSPLVLAGTAESTVKIIDSRTMQYVNEWKVSLNQNSTVRCLASAPSGNWIAVGLSSGNIVLLDGRTGILMSSWRATDGELLQLVAINDHQIVSSSLDHNISIWNVNDNSLQFQLKQPPEPAHCLQTVGSGLIFATPANRIGICPELRSHDVSYSISRLRSETLKGVLTSLAVLPLNRMILTGNDSGNIVLMC